MINVFLIGLIISYQQIMTTKPGKDTVQVNTRFTLPGEHISKVQSKKQKAMEAWTDLDCNYNTLPPLVSGRKTKRKTKEGQPLVVEFTVPARASFTLLDYRVIVDATHSLDLSWVLTNRDNDDFLDRQSNQTFSEGERHTHRYFVSPYDFTNTSTLHFSVVSSRIVSVEIQAWGCLSEQPGHAMRQGLKERARSPSMVAALTVTPKVKLTNRERAISNRIKYWRKPRGVAVQPHTLVKGASVKYVTFESDLGAFNNKRIAFESTVLFAVTTGRSLVIPPLSEYAWADYFDLDDLAEVLHLITAEEFLRRMQQQGKCEVSGWDVSDPLTLDQWKAGLRELESETYNEPWKPGIGVDSLFWPKDTSTGCNEECEKAFRRLRPGGNRVEYTEEMQESLIFHVPGGGDSRLLADHAAFIGFEDPIVEREALLLMRNHVHLRSYFFDIATQVLAKLPDNFRAMHVRRGDLQYAEAKAGAEVIYENVKALFDEGDTVYIATDEHDRSFFDGLSKHYNLVFFNDFPEVKRLAESLPRAAVEDWQAQHRREGDSYHQMFWAPDISGMVEAIITSTATTFVGTWLSTFSSLIFVLRGFHDATVDTNVYMTNKRYTGNPKKDAHHITSGHMGVGFHWQENMDRRWLYNDWQFS